MGRKLKITEQHKKIFLYLARGDRPKQISKNTGIRLNNLYKRIYVLRKYGYLKSEKIGQFLQIDLLPPALRHLTYFSGGIEKIQSIRLHDLFISLKVVRRPENWNTDFVEKILEEKSIEFTRQKLNNWKGLYFDYASVKVRVTPNKVLIKLPDISMGLEEEPEHLKNLALAYLDDVIPRVENLLKIKISKPRKLSVSVSSQHIAFVKNRIAKYFLDKGINMRVYDRSGRLRVIVDKSNGNEELEAIDKAHAEEDADRLQGLIKDVVFGKFDHRRIQEIQRDILLNQERQAQDFAYWAKHLKAHVTEIKKMSSIQAELLEFLKRDKK